MAAILAGKARAIELPTGFSAHKLCEGLTGATGMAVAPDGRIFVCEQTGAVRLVTQRGLLPQPVLTLAVDSEWERGLLGLALDPQFPRTPFFYVLWTAAKPWPHHRVSRFTLTENVADPSSEKILLEGDNQSEMPGTVKAGHQGGGFAFGPDGKLYLGLGEQTANTPAQDLKSLLGKILRLSPDGTPPADNPFLARTKDKYRTIWALGLRNPWVLAFQPGSGRLFINDIGASAYEEINEGFAGENYGWPLCEGEQQLPGYRDPLFEYNRSSGQSLGGGCFYPGKEVRGLETARPRAASSANPGVQGQAVSREITATPRSAWFPDEFAGKYFFQDYMAGWMSCFDPANPRKTVKTFAKGLAKPTAVAVAPDGSLLVLERNEWVKDERFREQTGWLTRIAPESSGAPSGTTERAAFPERLSQVGMFSSLAPLRPAPQVHLCRIRVPYWEPGAQVSHWLELPTGKRLGVDAAGEFIFPAGAVLVRHLNSKTTGKALLTACIWVQGSGKHHAATYRWRETEPEADMIKEAGVIETEGRKWMVGGPMTDLAFPAVAPGYVNELSAPNLAAPALSALCGRTPPVPAWARLEDHDSQVAERVRAWLDVNCSGCHRPGSVGRALFDLRFTTPLNETALVNGALISGEQGVAGARVIVPGRPERSMLLLRLKRPAGDPLRMPPACFHPEPPPVLPLLEQWIRRLR